ncbi:hypothetical protein ACFQ71_02910 [Streptomyces sp. NPDC056534]|uniref:hypothetical protein n=1 Tax=Streptomyces sp. NPDC056534 TaxID=3345857 RepID=UPI003676F606
MEFQISPDIAHLFADAVAAYMRGNAHTVRLNEKSELWNELWTTFRDADSATVTVPYEAGVLMFWVWTSPRWWRDRRAWEDVKAHLAPQWKGQMPQRVVARIEAREQS